MKMDPMPAAPTNGDLGLRLVQVHDCVENGKLTTEANFKKVDGKLETHRKALNRANAELKATRSDVLAIKETFKIGEGQKPTAGASTGWQAWRRTFLAVTSSITASAIVYKVGLAIGPGFIEMLRGLLHAMARGLL